MNADDAFSKLSVKVQNLAWETRARITWGTSADDARRWLRESGADARTIRIILAVCLKERARSMRIRGVCELLGGAALAVVGTAGFVTGVGPRIMGVSLIAMVGGFCLAMHGVLKLILGARAEGADSDVSGW